MSANDAILFFDQFMNYGLLFVALFIVRWFYDAVYYIWCRRFLATDTFERP